MRTFIFQYQREVHPLYFAPPIPSVDTWCQNIPSETPKRCEPAPWMYPYLFWPTPKEAGAPPVLPSIDPVDTWCQWREPFARSIERDPSVLPYLFWHTITPTSITWTSIGLESLFTASHWSNLTCYVEYYFRATSGTFYMRLYDTTTSSEVTGSSVSTTSATFDRFRVGPVVLKNGDEYRFQTGSISASDGEVIGARLILF